MVYKSLLLLTTVSGILLSASKANGRNHQSQSLRFIENKGQIVDQYHQARPDIDIKLAAGNGLNIFIGAGKVHYQWARPVVEVTNTTVPLQAMEQEPVAYKLYRMDMQLIGANLEAELILEEQQPFFERYFFPWLDKSNSGVQAFSYRKLTYRNIYPNIDWVFYFNKAGKLEHDFVVHPGGEVSDIQIKYGGAGRLAVEESGQLKAGTPLGSITENAPYSFQQDGRLIPSRFILQDGILSFEVAAYTGTLIIDPTLEWATYYGGLGTDMGYGLAHDNNGNVYMAGISSSMEHIATTGSYQQTMAGSADAFISKCNTDGELIWATYYGGTMEDRATDIKYDSLNDALYVAGVTQSPEGIATATAHQPAHGGSYDVFLARFDTAGQKVWSTYYGGSGSDGSGLIAGLSCDASGNIFLCSETNSAANISSPGAQQEVNGGAADGFIAKFDASGQRIWGTYIGGAGNDHARKLGCDSSGNVYLGGYTSSTSGIATTNANQETFGGVNDAFLAKFNAAGSLQWATYYGGALSETFNALGTAADGTVYMGGTTSSTSDIATVGSHQSTFGGMIDGFLAQFSAEGALQWATYVGGEAADLINFITIHEEHAYLGGMSNSASGIATPGSLIDTANDSYQLFLTKFTPAGTRLWGTYYGGTGSEAGNSATIDDAYNLYVTGYTNSAAEIATAGSHQPGFGGGAYDAFLLKLNVCEQPPAPLALNGDTLICEGQSYTYTTDSVPGAIAYQWLLPTGWAGSSTDTSITLVPDATSGVLSVAALNSCATSDTLSMHITVNPAPVPVIQQEDGVLSTTESFSTYQWIRNEEDIAGATQATYTAVDTGMYAVRVTNEEGCSGTSEAIAAGSTSATELAALSRAIRVYPNPAHSMVQIQAPIPVSVVITGIAGKRLLLAERASTVDLSQLSAGMYLLQVYDKEGRLLKTEKVVKNVSW